MSFERPRSQAEQFPELMEILPRAQALLALQELRDQKPELAIDIEHPENNAREVRSEAMGHWVEECAADFRTYVEQHPHERVDIENEQVRERLLRDIHTIH